MSGETNSDKVKIALMHVHKCVHCGQTRYREEVGDHEINSGIVHCWGCGMDGPLNVEIRNLSAE